MKLFFKRIVSLIMIFTIVLSVSVFAPVDVRAETLFNGIPYSAVYEGNYSSTDKIVFSIEAINVLEKKFSGHVYIKDEVNNTYEIDKDITGKIEIGNNNNISMELAERWLRFFCFLQNV